MAHIEKRTTSKGETRYRAQVVLKGHPRLSQTFGTRRAAKRWAERTTEAIRQRRFQPESEAEQRTVSELVERFIRDKLPELCLTDQSHLAGKLRWWAGQLGGGTTLARVTPAAITLARDRLAAGQSLSGKRPSPHTIKRYLAILSRAMSVATKEWWWMEENPCARVVRPKEPRGRVRFLSKECRATGQTRRKATPSVTTELTTG